jgi:hypothetical protein
VAASTFRPLITFVAIDVVAKSGTFGPVRPVGTLAANRALRPFDLAADVALRCSEPIGFDTDRATRRRIDDLDVAAFMIDAVAIGARR